MEKAAPRPRYPIFSLTETLELPEPSWLVPGLLQEDSISLLYGPPASYKTFLALDLCLSLAAGESFLGHPTPGDRSCIYVTAEGRLNQRALAWGQHHGFDPRALGELGCYFLHEPVALADTDAVRAFLGAVSDRWIERPALIVFDTLAKMSHGADENSATEMQALFDGADIVRRATGAAVLIIHHVARGTNRPRGSSAIDGAVDTLLLLSRDEESNTLGLEVLKQRNTETVGVWTLRPKLVRDSLVLEPAQSEIVPEARLLRLLTEAGLTHGQWQERALAVGIAGGSFDRLRKRLLSDGRVARIGTGKNTLYALHDGPEPISSYAESS